MLLVIFKKKFETNNLKLITIICLSLIILFNFNLIVNAKLLPIIGEVKELNGTPVSNAKVILINEGNDETGSSDITYTNPKGQFYFVNKPPGIYSIIIQKEGYLPYQDTITSTFSERKIIKISLTKSDTFEPDVIYLAKNTGNIYGSVICEQTLEPISDALVVIDDKFVQTNEQGNFKLENIGVGPKIIKVQKNGYEKLEKEITISVKPQNAIIYLKKIIKYGTILGKVKIRGKKDNECPPIKVYLAGKTTTTDKYGKFKFENIVSGNYPIIMIYNKKEVYNEIIKVDKDIFAFEVIIDNLY